jgi:hypothetical protein
MKWNYDFITIDIIRTLYYCDLTITQLRQQILQYQCLV